jgi:hypothetical protein
LNLQKLIQSLHVFKVSYWLPMFQNMKDNDKLHIFFHLANPLCINYLLQDKIKLCNTIVFLIFSMLCVGTCVKFPNFLPWSKVGTLPPPTILVEPIQFGH